MGGTDCVDQNTNTDLSGPACPHRYGYPHTDHRNDFDYGAFSKAKMVQRLGRGYLPAMIHSFSLQRQKRDQALHYTIVENGVKP